MSWTDERVEILKKMWGEGQSASQIAKELGGVTRNAVIGKVHRLGLSNRAGSGGGAGAAAPKAEPKTKPAAKAKPAVKAKPKAKSPATENPKADESADPAPATESARPAGPARRAIIPAGQPLPPQPSANEIDPAALAKVNEVEKGAKKLNLMELTERTCKWPIGDPATEEFWFCGLPVQQGKPYCEAHVGVAFQPMSSRRDRKR
ncbi:GcrA family cell cycle regulator [Salibaculum griseiflavum]|jgi:GcrA cell cycle regulator|uniref:GcrA cell cycle regulator n=1 Tax=Salibaculum griseiflavum TaxID=1914409 RepID=A0A2V1P7K7_9RHOB|nr:GcrA family cell cycle regulator [Salibaculum griseiflavum]PWG17824.1 GcrA cell cycle regulator [Salibaculum griseiflavum]